jgi:hypothetical protein
VRIAGHHALIPSLLLCACGSAESGPADDTPSISDELDTNGTHPKVAIAEDGTSVVVWSHESELHSQRFVPGIGWEKSRVVRQAESPSGTIEPQTLESRDGRTLLTFIELIEDAQWQFTSRLSATWQAPDGSWSEPEVLEDPIPSSSTYAFYVHSVSASLGRDGGALVSWLWGGNVESYGFGRELRFSRYVKGSWAAVEGEAVTGLPPWRPAVLASDGGGTSTIVTAEDDRLRALRCDDGGSCVEEDTLWNQSPGGFLPSLAIGSGRDAIALVTEGYGTKTRLVGFSSASSSWEVLQETEIPLADWSLTPRADTSALATWSQPSGSSPGQGTLMGAVYRRSTGFLPAFVMQESGYPFLSRDAASAANGEALVAWTELDSVWVRRVHSDGTPSAPLRVASVEPDQHFGSGDVAVATAASGVGVMAWTEAPSDPTLPKRLHVARVH